MGVRPVNVVLAARMQGDGLKQAQAEVTKVGDAVTKMSDKVLKAASAFISFQSAVNAGRFLLGSIEQARDLERNMFGLETVFGRVAPQFEAFTKQAEEFGLSQSEAAKASTFLGSVLKQSGYGLQEQADLTQKLVKLAADLAITYGYDVQEALLGMTALFRGEYDPIEKFGVAMKQNEINMIAAQRGMKDLTGEAERFAHQQIRVELLFQRAADAMGAFERQNGSLFAEQEKLQAAFNNMRQELGQGLLPVFAELVTQIRPLIKELTPQLISSFSSLVGVVKALGNDIDGVKEFVGNLIEAFQTLVEIASILTEIFIKFHDIIIPFAIAVGVLSAAIKVYTGAVVAATAATKAFDITLRTTLIGRIATAVFLAAAAFGVLYTESRRARNEMERLAAANNRTVAEQKEYNEVLNAYLLTQENNRKGARNSEYAVRLLRDETVGLNKELERAEGMRFEKLRESLLGVADAAKKAAISQQQLTYQYLNFRRIERGLPPIDIMTGLLIPPETETGEGGKITDWVKEFFKSLEDEVKKQNARVKLEALGASEGLIESIVGAPGDWEAVYKRILRGGRAFVAELQKTFNRTATGLEEVRKAQEEAAKAAEEAAKAAREAYEAAQREFERFVESAREAEKAVLDLVRSFDVLPTIEPQMGRFERAVVDQLASIEDSLKGAFENGAILESSYNNLLSYARAELAVLQQIQRQRDDLARRRDLAQALISDTQAAIIASGNIANLLQTASRAAERVDMTEVIQDTVRAGKRLTEFRTTIIRNFVEPIAEVKSKTRELLDAYSDVVGITRRFVDNMKRLRAMGLDETLFAQLVEAGAEAGGATAQALVDGGQDAVNELNGLFSELNELGGELGEQTAQVMYGEGENFVNGIIDGLNSQLANLENTARSLAEAFVTTFSSILQAGIEAAIAAAQRAMDMQMPVSVGPVGGFTPVPPTQSTFTDGTGGTGGANAGSVPSRNLPQTPVVDVRLPSIPPPVIGGRGTPSDLFSGLTPGMTPQEIWQVPRGTTTTNITVNVTQPNAKPNDIVKAIDSYVKKNGPVTGIIGGTGRVAV